MCGLVGMAGNLNEGHNVAFRNLLLLDQIRGFDSTGVARVQIQSKFAIVSKELGSPAHLFEKSHMFNSKGIFNLTPRVAIGHNRAATIGKVTEDNAHPFTFGHITGAHNGTLKDWSDLEGYAEHDVDSKALFNTIEKKGIEHAWKSFEGAAAITYWDEEKETLGLIRNKHRPLYVGWTTKDSILWASEEWMLYAAIAGTDIEWRTRTEKDDKGNEEEVDDVILLKEHTLHLFKPTGTTCPLVEVKELEFRPDKPSGFTGYGWSGDRYTGKKSWEPKGAGCGGKSGGEINEGWAEGLAKAPKELVGKTFKLERSFEFLKYGKKQFYVLSGTIIEDGSIIQIMPETYDQWETWADALREGGWKDKVFRLERRPRYLTSSYDKTKATFYRIPFKYVREVGTDAILSPPRYTMPSGITTVKEDAEAALYIAGNECCACSTTLTVDDDYDLIYNGGAALCKKCANDKPTMEWLFGLNNYGGIQ